MRRSVTTFPILWLGLLIGVCTGIASIILKIDGSAAVILILSQLILANCMEILVRIQGLRILSALPPAALQAVLSNTQVAATVSRMLQWNREAGELRHPVLQEEYRRLVAQNLNDLERLADGGLETRPVTRPYFRDLAVIDDIKFELLATSMVNPKTYWESVSGRNYLERQASALTRVQRRRRRNQPIPFQRVFIQEASKLVDLVPTLRLHKQLGISAFVALHGEVPPDLRRDFYVIDQEFLVYLNLDPEGETLGAGFVVKGGSRDADVNEALRRFESLKRYSRLPEDVDEIKDLLL